MKKTTMTTLLLLFLSLGLFAQAETYTAADLSKYLIDAPGSRLPNEKEKVFVQSGVFTVEYEADDSLGGMVYLVEDAGLKLRGINYAKPIIIYSDGIQTRKVPAFMGTPSYIIFDEAITIRFTGYFTTVINSRGIESEAPIFTTN